MKKKYSPAFLASVEYDLFLILLSVIGIFIFNFGFLFLPIKKEIEKNTALLLKFISPRDDIDNAILEISIDEYRTIAQKFIDERHEITQLLDEKAYYEARKNIAEQVAHDIRSPLAAINTALSNLSAITENRRLMIKNASIRINDIANNLLSQFKNTSTDISTDSQLEPELIFIILDSISSEKRYEYELRSVEIRLNVTQAAHSCFSNIDSASFKRMLSNLINNSMEAIKKSGVITISLTCNEQQLEIIIEDDGCGIPADILPRITNRGYSYKKKSGAGFGLSYAKEYVERLQGKMSINSTIGIGTKIIITLARCNAPEWFCETLQISTHSTVAILDDSQSIHETWQERLRDFQDINLIDAHDVGSLLQKTHHIKNTCLYLIDYELVDSKKNGLDIIEALSMEKNAILVTSNFENINVRKRAEKIGIKIIPKPYVPYIPISLMQDNLKEPVSILIDDDEMMRMAWQFAAENAGKELLTFASFDEFNSNAIGLEKNSIIYIDSHLGENSRGEDHAKILHDNGFTEIYLTTGYAQNKFKAMPWIKAIRGKEPPFLT